jgi:chloramphenicol 3-O phosphotransferase
MASAGNDLVVEHVIEYPEWRADLARLLGGFDVFLVGVHCSLDELDRRERARGDRTPGEGRAHVVDNRIHELGPYDHELDATAGATPQVAADLVTAWRARRGPSALFTDL